jgi:hypothetical protein
MDFCSHGPLVEEVAAVSQMGEADRGISGGDAQCDMASSDSSDMTMAPCIMHQRL